MIFRKKPVIIEAIQFDGKNHSEICSFIKTEDNVTEAIIASNLPYFTIYTLEGNLKAQPNYWIIKGIKGEFYPCKPDIFEQIYEEVKV